MLPPLPQAITDKLPEAKKLLMRPEVRAFAGLHPIKLKPRITRERVPMTKTTDAGMPIGSFGFFLPLSSEEIPAKNRKIFSKLHAQPIQLSSGLTKANNYQSNLLHKSSKDSEDFTAFDKNLTCRAPKTCFVFTQPSSFTPTVVAMVDKFVEQAEKNLVKNLELLLPDASYRPLAEGDSVCFFPRDIKDVKKVLGLCMVDRVYSARFKGRNMNGRKSNTSILEISVDNKTIEFTAREESFISEFKPADFQKALDLIKTHEQALVKDLGGLLGEDSGGSDKITGKITHEAYTPETAVVLEIAPVCSSETYASEVEDCKSSEALEDLNPGQFAVVEEVPPEVSEEPSQDCEELAPGQLLSEVDPPEEAHLPIDLVTLEDEGLYEGENNSAEDLSQQDLLDCQLPPSIQSFMTHCMTMFQKQMEATNKELLEAKVKIATLELKNKILLARDNSILVSLS